MAQTAEAQVKRYLSVCCEAPIDPASFSDGRGFLICSECGRVLAVEPADGRRTPHYSGE